MTNSSPSRKDHIPKEKIPAMLSELRQKKKTKNKKSTKQSASDNTMDREESVPKRQRKSEGQLPAAILSKPLLDQKIQSAKTRFAKETVKEQTWPEPTVPIHVLPRDEQDEYPEGQILKHPLDHNTYRYTSEELKRKEEKFEKRYQAARHGAEVHRTVRRWLRETVAKPGMRLIDICKLTENKVRELLSSDGLEGGMAFPMGCSLNECVAHYTPNTGDNTILTKKDVVKFDIGVHVNGRIIDCAFTQCFDDKYQPLLDAVREATNAGISAAGIDVRLYDIGAEIQEVMESHEMELNGRMHPIRCVRNLCGHNIEHYMIHGDKSVPIVKGGSPVKMEENEFYAIETFGTTGKGRAVEKGECSHYMKNFDVDSKRVVLRNKRAKHLLNVIDENFSTLAWCRRYLDRLGETKHMHALDILVDEGIIEPYPPLCDVKGSYSAQYEHTLVLRPTCKEVISRGDDY